MTLNATKLDSELRAAGLPIVGCNSDGLVTWANGVIPTQGQIDQANAIIAVHDPIDYVALVQAGAESQAEAIPGWATWTEAEALDYINTNVVDLPSALIVLRAMARMLVALRNNTWPRLEGS